MDNVFKKTFVGTFFLAVVFFIVALLNERKLPLEIDGFRISTVILTIQAALGDPDKQYALAIRSKNPEDYSKLLQTAYNNGHIPSGMELAASYQGYGVKPAKTKRLSDAIDIYENLADQGVSDALAELCRLYQTDQLIDGESIKDYKKAVPFCKQAVEKNNPKAMYLLLWLYHQDNSDELGLEGGIQQSGDYLRKSADQGYSQALTTIKKLQEGCFTASNAISAHQRAYTCEFLAAAGDSEAQLITGQLYREGRYVKKDIQTAIHWLERADEQENAKAALALGMIYTLEKDGVEKNTSLARKYFKSAQQNHHKNTMTRDRLDARMWLKILDMKEKNALEAKEN